MSLLTSAATMVSLVWQATNTRLLAQPLTPASHEIPPLAPPLPEIPPTHWEQFGWLLWIVIPLLLVVGGIVVWLLLRPGKPPLLPAPAAEARATLLALQARPETGTALSQISHTLRRYLITAFWLPPHEMTTQDFCSHLTASKSISPEMAAAMGEFLKACDERKFSPNAATPPLGAAQRALELVSLAEARKQPDRTATPS